jgi:hypothetical protein
MFLREFLNRTGEGKAAVVGWGRGMGHKGHMYLASSVITQAKDHGADPYFVVSRTVGKDDPITPDEKLGIYKKVFPKHGHIFHTATDEMPDLTRVLTQLSKHGYTDVTVVVGADQVGALSYVKNYNGKPDKSGNIPFDFNTLNVIARQETNDPSAGEEGPRATPMRAILQDPNATEEEKFAAWRDAMSPELSDDEVRELMNKAQQRMADPAFGKAPKKPKKEKVADESLMGFLGKVEKPVKKKPVASAEEMRKWFEKEKAKDSDKIERGTGDKKAQQVYTRSDENLIKYANRMVREMRAQEFVRRQLNEKATITSATPDAPYAGQGDSDDLADEHLAGLNHAVSFPSISMNKSNGSSYLQYRFGLAMAGAHPNPNDHMPTPMSTGGAFSGDPLIAPFSDQDLEIVKAAGKHIGAGKMTRLADKSNEMSDTNKLSPVAKQKKNRYGV